LTVDEKRGYDRIHDLGAQNARFLIDPKKAEEHVSFGKGRMGEIGPNLSFSKRKKDRRREQWHKKKGGQIRKKKEERLDGIGDSLREGTRGAQMCSR